MNEENETNGTTKEPSLAITDSLQAGRIAAFTLDSAFIDSLAQRLQEERVKANERMRKVRGLSGRLISHDVYSAETVPSTTDLRLLIEAAFWASLEREEGRPLKFRIYYGPPSDYATLKFRVAKRYSVATLVKLASAVSNKVFGIAAYKSGNGEPNVWGLEGNAPLTIDVLEPGKLIIKFSTENVAAISGAQTLLIRSPHVIFLSLWERFKPTDQAADYFAWTDPRVRTLLAVLRYMQEFHHGGVVVVVPEDDSWRSSITAMSYEAEGPSSALSQVIDRLNDKLRDGASLFSRELDSDHSFLDILSRGLASLTCVDGAVVVNYHLQILGFGAKFNIPPNDASKPTSILMIDPLERQRHTGPLSLEELEWGMRHQSAARFVLANHETVAFVASQDGGVTAFAWEQWGENSQYASLVAYSQLELTMF